MKRQRNPWAIVAVGVVIAMINFMSVARSPEFEAMRTVHIIQLIAGGAVLGASIAGAMARYRATRPS